MLKSWFWDWRGRRAAPTKKKTKKKKRLRPSKNGLRLRNIDIGFKAGHFFSGAKNFQDKIHMSLHVWCGAKNNPTHLSDLWRAELIFEPNLANGAEEENTEAREETLQLKEKKLV